jgi:hypothetical protein
MTPIHRSLVLSRRKVIALVATIVVGGSAPSVLSYVGDLPGDGCSQAAASSIIESSAFTPYEQRLTHTRPQPINPDQTSAGHANTLGISKVDGLGVAWATQTEDGRVATYYLDRPIGPSLTHDEFFANGGVLLMAIPSDPKAGPYVDGLKAQLGDRVVVVKVGGFNAALTWSDPKANGIRPHYLAWSDGVSDFTLIAVRPADAVVNIARTAVC